MFFEKIAFVNGCFDVLHTGHLNLLDAARETGGYVLVAIDEDSRVRQHKGISRPVNNYIDRLRMLNSLKQVDSVVTFDSDQELYEIIKSASSATKKFIMVKGADYKDKPVIGSDLCDDIIYVELNGKSTTCILGR